MLAPDSYAPETTPCFTNCGTCSACLSPDLVMDWEAREAFKDLHAEIKVIRDHVHDMNTRIVLMESKFYWYDTFTKSGIITVVTGTITGLGLALAKLWHWINK